MLKAILVVDSNFCICGGKEWNTKKIYLRPQNGGLLRCQIFAEGSIPVYEIWKSWKGGNSLAVYL